MIITNIQELRLHFPTHAIDHIEAYTGFIDNSEHEFLLNPLGQPLYEKLCEWYESQQGTYSKADGKDVGYYNRLLLMAQRCVAFDAMSRSIDQQSVSMNNAGVNMSFTEDYKPADGDAISRAKSAYIKEAHSSLNRLLYTLEQWTAICPADEDVTPETEELHEIVSYWRSSRYFYLAGNMLIPSAVVLQEYLDYLDSREKFIRMLPDFRFIQEEVLAPAIGEDFFDWIISQVVSGKLNDNQPTVMSRLLRKLRKIDTCYLEGRTSVIKVDKQRKMDAHDEGVRLLGSFCDYCRQHQADILTALGDQANAYRNSHLYIEPQPEPTTVPGASPSGCKCSDFNNPDMALHVTMPLL